MKLHRPANLSLSSEEVIKANEETVFAAPYESSGFGPVVDGIFIPELPTLLLSSGKYAKNVRAVMSGHNTDEGLIFTNPAIQKHIRIRCLSCRERIT
jgi:carboxylesterase type B